MSLSVYFWKFNIIYLPGHIATASYNLVIVEEPTATEVASVSRKFPADPNIAFASFQAKIQEFILYFYQNIIDKVYIS